jgi:hypothetical protein
MAWGHRTRVEPLHDPQYLTTRTYRKSCGTLQTDRLVQLAAFELEVVELSLGVHVAFGCQIRGFGSIKK